MTRSVKTLLAVAGLAVILLAARSTQAQQTPTQEIAECMDNAAQVFADCVRDHAWYVAPLCAAAYAADELLCVPERILPGGD